MNEHYVPQSYLRQFAPDNANLISRYSLTDMHGGGDYYSSGRYPISKAASEEGFADGHLEQSGVTDAEGDVLNIFRKLKNRETLTGDEYGNLSWYMGLQFERTPKQQMFRQTADGLSKYTDEFESGGWTEAIENVTSGGHKNLQQFGWLLIENRTTQQLITSDHPVVTYPTQQEDRDTDSNENVEIFYPIGPNHLIALLHPAHYNIEPLYPKKRVRQIVIESRTEIHKLNLLQPLSAFSEIFGAVGEDEYLEKLVTTLCNAFPNPDYVRGPQCSREDIEWAHELAMEHYSEVGGMEWYNESIRPIFEAENHESVALRDYSHSLSFVDELRDTT